MVVSGGLCPQQTPKSRADRSARLSVVLAQFLFGHSEAAPPRHNPIGLVPFRAGSMSDVRAAEIVLELMRAIWCGGG